MMPPTIKFTGNTLLKTEGQKDPLIGENGAAFATFMLCRPDQGMTDTDQISVTTAEIVDNTTEEEQTDEIIPKEDGSLPPALPITAPDPSPKLLSQNTVPAAGNGPTVSNTISGGATAGVTQTSPPGPPAEMMGTGGAAPGHDLPFGPSENHGSVQKPGAEVSTSVVDVDLASRLPIKTNIALAPSFVETPAPDQADEPSGIPAEIRIQGGVETKIDLVTAPSPAPGNALQVARNVVRQITPHIADQHGSQIEITLTPEELGTVRLIISAGDRPAVAVYAENPATLDLLRRHAELLARELRDTGLAGADLSFADNRGADHRQAAADRNNYEGFAADRGAPQADVQIPMARSRPALGSLIDIRI